MPIRVPTPLVYASFVGTIGAGGVLLRDYLTRSRLEENEEKAEKEKEMADIEGKVVIITGANTGIGKATALDLAKRKAKVIMACRDIDKCEQAREDIVLQTKNKYVYCRKCDLASLNSVRQFSERFKKENDRLDILINNAAVMRCPYSKTEDGFELQLGVNHMGHFLLTNLLLDVMKRSAPSRIINVTCGAYAGGKLNKEDLNSEKEYDPTNAYLQSKLANVIVTMELHKQLRETGVTVNAVDPGMTDTALNRHMDSTSNQFSRLVLSPLLYVVTRTPKQGAETVVHVSTSPQYDRVSGKLYSDSGETPISRLGADKRLGKWLWLTSEKWTKLDTTAVAKT